MENRPTISNKKSVVDIDSMKKASGNVISSCLKILPGEEVAIICEQDRLLAAEYLSYDILKNGAFPIVIPIFNETRSILSKGGLPLSLSPSTGTLLDNVSVIITLIDNIVGELPFRKQILDHLKTGNCRIAHMPGIKLDQFADYLKGDFTEIKRKGKKLKNILHENIGQSLQIITKSGTDLTVKISPHIHLSTGILKKLGEMGNLPGGEVYFVPEPDTANGKLVIDVSIPNLKLKGNKPIEFQVIEGKAIIDTISDPYNKMAGYLQTKGADVLCEVGIGLNDEIEEPTGNALIDEKMGNTIHVAFGDNTLFGGSNKSNAHLDLVMSDPIVKLEGNQIVNY
jgi:hypothetical protein